MTEDVGGRKSHRKFAIRPTILRRTILKQAAQIVNASARATAKRRDCTNSERFSADVCGPVTTALALPSFLLALRGGIPAFVSKCVSGTSIAFLSSSQRRLRLPDRSSPLKAGVQGQALSPHCGLGAVVALRLTKPPSDRPREIADTITQGNKGNLMSYLVPSEFVTKMVDAGEAKVFMSTRDTVIRAYMAGAILALAAWFAVTINTNTGQPIVGALLFPVGFVMLNLF